VNKDSYLNQIGFSISKPRKSEVLDDLVDKMCLSDEEDENSQSSDDHLLNKQ